MDTPARIFDVGTEVVRQSDRLGQIVYGPIEKIVKVYKNGNFVLPGSSQQYRPGYDDTYARATGGGYSPVRVCRVTPEMRVTLETYYEHRRNAGVIVKEVERLKVILQRNDATEIRLTASVMIK